MTELVARKKGTSRLDPLEGEIDAALEEKLNQAERTLLKAIGARELELEGRGRLGGGLHWAEVSDLCVADLRTRAGLIYGAYLKRMRTRGIAEPADRALAGERMGIRLDAEAAKIRKCLRGPDQSRFDHALDLKKREIAAEIMGSAIRQSEDSAEPEAPDAWREIAVKVVSGVGVVFVLWLLNKVGHLLLEIWKLR